MCFAELRALHQYSMCVRISLFFFFFFWHLSTIAALFISMCSMLGVPSSSCGIIDYHIYRQRYPNNISIRLLLFLLINLETIFSTETLRVTYALRPKQHPTNQIIIIVWLRGETRKREKRMCDDAFE